MNLENQDFDFDFKPITSGLGFHHEKATEVKPIMTEKTVTLSPLPSASTPKREMNLYQNDLSLFYGQSLNEAPVRSPEAFEEKTFAEASRVQRISAYLVDLLLVVSVLAIVVTVMARTISMDLIEIWESYPHEVTPLVATLFCGFYLLYFSVFEVTGQTLGKALFGLRITDRSHKNLPLTVLLMRTTVSLLNFASLGLFSYFDLANKITHSKVIRVD